MKRTGKEKKKVTFGTVLKRILQVFGTLLLIGVLTAMIFACIFAVYIKSNLSRQVDFTVEDFALNQTSVIYCQNPDTGEWEELQKLYSNENRIWASYDELPKDLIRSCIAIEDKRFYTHRGVDFITTAKACVKLFLGNASAGGSTITQQLIKNLTDNKEITVRRKIVEIFSALEFEKTHSKEEVLEWYMNVIYFGRGCYGVRSAAQTYFGKELSELSLAECASLISITNNPSLFDPYIRPENNRKRQMFVLGELLNQGTISREQYDEAVAEEMVFTSGTEEDESIYYSYFVDQVIREVLDDLTDKTGYSYEIAKKMLYCGGYSIYSTMNPKVQEAMDAVYEDLSNVPATASSQQLQSGMVVIDNATGDVAGLSGGVGKKSGSLTWSYATQSLLSPGSTIKPLSIYGPALDLGIISPATVFDDVPYSFTNNVAWPKNSDNVYHGLVTVNEALGLSLNTVAVQLAARMGPDYCFNYAKEKMGLSTLVSELVIDGRTYSDIALAPMSMGGLTRGVTVKAMTEAYAAIANGGNYRDGRVYTRVEDANGKVILTKEQEKHAALKSTSAWYLTYMLEDAVKNGTGAPAAMRNIAVAGKTGTTDSDQDRWFAGWTPYYTGVVWCGYDIPEEIVLTESTTNPAIALWKKVMDLAHEGLAPRQFAQPANLKACEVCTCSGLLPADACRRDPRGAQTQTFLLLENDVPKESCKTHVNLDVCTKSGCLATRHCGKDPENDVRTVALLNVKRLFPMQNLYVSDQTYAMPLSRSEIPFGYYEAKAYETFPYDADRICQVHTASGEEPVPVRPGEEDEWPDPGEIIWPTEPTTGA